MQYFTNLRFNTTGYTVNAEFYGCSNLVEIDLRTIPYLSASLFQGCNKLKKINNLRKTVQIEQSGNGPFYQCSALEGEIDLTDGRWYRSGVVNDIRSQVFRQTGFSAIHLPKATSSITTNYVFYNASKLKSLIVPSETLVTITNSGALTNMPSSTNIYVPDELVASYKAASYWSARASHIKPLSEYTG